LNPEVIEQVRAAWDLTIRDGYGQTETTAQIGNSPGQVIKVGTMGRPLPGYPVRLFDLDGNLAQEGEVCLALGEARPAGLMQGYQNADGTVSGADGALYRTGDIALADEDGYLTFVGRSDDVFKSSDYRISPFELESVLIEHAAVAEAAVIPAPDAIRLSVPKAYISLLPGIEPSPETVLSIFQYTHTRLAPFKRIRQIEIVSDLPRTISGKIKRGQLRRLELANDRSGPLRGVEYAEDDFAELQVRRSTVPSGSSE
jgi:acetyl-CoA synthetase